nr:hypothetical protein [uncultured Halomonas sp.]
MIHKAELKAMAVYSSGGGEFYNFIDVNYSENGVSINDPIDMYIVFLLYKSYSKDPFFYERSMEFYYILHGNKDLSKKVSRFQVRIKNSKKIQKTHQFFLLFIISSIVFDAAFLFSFLEEVTNSNDIKSALNFRRAVRFVKERGGFDYSLKLANEVELLLTKFIRKRINDQFLTPRSAPVLDSNDKNVLMVLSYLPPNFKTGAHFRQIKLLCETLALAGVKVGLLITNEDSLDANDYLKYRYYNERSREKLKNYLVINEKVELINAPYIDDVSYCEKVINKFYNFNPTHVIKLGGALESVVFNDLFKKLPSIYRQFNMHNIPSDKHDLYLYQGSGNDVLSKEKWVESPIPMFFERVNSDYLKEKHVHKEKVIIVTVLGNGRLENAFKNYSEKMLGHFRRVLDLNVEWFMVGVQREEIILDIINPSSTQKDKIKIIQHHNDLNSLYETADIFVLLPGMTGGGGGAAQAICKGVSCILPNTVDAANFVDGNNVFSIESELMQKIEELVTSAEKRFNNSVSNLSVVSKRSPERLGSIFLELLDKADYNFKN